MPLWVEIYWNHTQECSKNVYKWQKNCYDIHTHTHSHKITIGYVVSDFFSFYSAVEVEKCNFMTWIGVFFLYFPLCPLSLLYYNNLFLEQHKKKLDFFLYSFIDLFAFYFPCFSPPTEEKKKKIHGIITVEKKMETYSECHKIT